VFTWDCLKKGTLKKHRVTSQLNKGLCSGEQYEQMQHMAAVYLWNEMHLRISIKRIYSTLVLKLNYTCYSICLPVIYFVCNTSSGSQLSGTNKRTSEIIFFVLMWHDARCLPCTHILDQQWCERNNFHCSKNIGTHVCLYFSPQISAYFYLPSNHLIIPLLGNLWAVRNGLSALHLSMHYRKELEKCWLQLYFQLIFWGLFVKSF